MYGDSGGGDSGVYGVHEAVTDICGDFLRHLGSCAAYPVDASGVGRRARGYMHLGYEGP